MSQQFNPNSRSDYQLVIEQILQGELQPSRQGVVTLPIQLASTSEGGRVLVTTHESGAVSIAFASWIGKGDNMRGFLYANQRLTPNDSFHDVYGNKTIRIGSTEVVIESKIDEHWYSISRSLD